MAKKKDPSVTFLNRFGYNVVKLPRVGIEPMDLVGVDNNNSQRLGPIRVVWKSSAAEPSPSAPNPAAALAGQQTDQMELKVGLRILANALAAFGATVPSVDFAYSRARKVQFAYTGVTSTSVDAVSAGEYLTKGTLNTENPIVRRYFEDPEAEAFLILDVLKSASVTVTATDERGTSVGVDVPAIQGVVGANVGVKINAAANNSVTYSGPVPVTFAFAVDRIEFDGTRWSLSGQAPAGFLAFAAGAAGTAPPTAGPVILGSGCTLTMS